MIRTTGRSLGLTASLLLALVWAGCARTDIFAQDPDAVPRVVIDPAPKTLAAGKSVQFSAKVAPNARGEKFEWAVATEAGGTITAEGLYTAPESFPEGVETNFPVVITARVVGDDLTGEAKLTIVPDNTLPAVTLEKVAGDDQTGTAGALLPAPLVVKALDEEGNGVEGLALRFHSPLGEAEGIDVVTDVDGQAIAQPKAGAPASTQIFLVTSEKLNPVAFTAQIAPGPVANLKASHPKTMGAFNEKLADPATLIFTDAFGNRLEGRSAAVSAPVGAVATPLGASSNGIGVLQFSIQLGSVTGVQEFIFADAQFPNVTAKLTFTATGGTPTLLQRVSGDGQTGVVATALGQPLIVRVLDQFGQPVSGTTVTWTSLDGGSFGTVSLTSDANGYANAAAVLGTKAGPQRFEVDAGRITNSPMTFVAVAKAGVATNLALTGGANQSTGAGSPFGNAFSVLATDAFGNPVAGVPVHFEVISGGGSVSPNDIPTGADGLAQARMVAGANGGAQVYRATSPSLIGSPIDLTLSAGPPVVYHLELISGDAQKGRAGSPLAQPLVVRVTNNGQPVANQVVTFGVAVGDGKVLPVNVTTGADGVALTNATLGSIVGPNRFSATLPGADNSPLFFEATVEGAAVASLQVIGGAGQTGNTGTKLGQPLSVVALDVNGQVVPGVTVTFTPPAGGSVDSPTVVTDSAGIASTLATLGPAAGDQEFIASVGSITASIRVTAIVNGQTLILVSGDGQQSTAGTDLTQPLVVQLLDANANPVAGATVAWAALSPGATVSASTVTTDAQGFAQVKVRLGSTIGTQQFTASVTGAAGSPVTFTAAGLVGSATGLIIVDGDNQVGAISTGLAKPFTVKVIDSSGNGVAGVTVDFAAIAGGGSVFPASGVSNADGIVFAAGTLGPQSGPQSFTATAASIPSTVTFTATATSGTLTRLEISPLNSTLQVGASDRFSAIAIYSDGSSQVVTEQATWSSDAVNLATVSDAAGSKGVVVAQSGGKATITATFGGQSASATLTVRGMVSITSITIQPVDAAVVLGGQLQFLAIATYSDNTTGEVTDSATWTSSDTTIATVSDATGTKGLAAGVNAGTVTVKVTLNGVSGTRSFTVFQSNLKRLEITPTGVTKAAGVTVAFKATATFENGTVQDVTSQVQWASSDASVVSVQASGPQMGLATLLAAGSATVSATYLGQTATAPVVVTSSTLKSITLTPQNITLAVNDFIQYTATATYTDGTTADVTTAVLWSSSSSTVAGVSNAPDSIGVATAYGAGNATITATLGGVTGTATMTVDNAVIRAMIITDNSQGFPNPNPTFSCNPGQTIQLRALAFYQSGFGGRPADITDQVSWTTTNSAVATVGQGATLGGRVICIAQGTVTLRATFNGVSASGTLNVSNATVTSVSVAPASGTFGIGDSRQFYATALYSNGQTAEITSQATWATADANVATVSNATGSRGLLVATGVGTTTLTATFRGVTGSASVKVSNAKLTQVLVTPVNTAVAYQRNRRVQFSATAMYDDGSQVDVTSQSTWSSSDSGVARMDTSPVGRVTFAGRGTTTIAASYSGLTGSTTLSVY